jgi:hypothetical protein
VIADGLQQKAFAASVFAHDKPEGRAAFLYKPYVPKNRFDFRITANGNILQADTGNDAAF